MERQNKESNHNEQQKNASLPPPGDSETFSQQYEHQKEHQETDGEQ